MSKTERMEQDFDVDNLFSFCYENISFWPTETFTHFLRVETFIVILFRLYLGQLFVLGAWNYYQILFFALRRTLGNSPGVSLPRRRAGQNRRSHQDQVLTGCSDFDLLWTGRSSTPADRLNECWFVFVLPALHRLNGAFICDFDYSCRKLLWVVLWNFSNHRFRVVVVRKRTDKSKLCWYCSPLQNGFICIQHPLGNCILREKVNVKVPDLIYR